MWRGPAAEVSLYRALSCWDRGIEGKPAARRWRGTSTVLALLLIKNSPYSLQESLEFTGHSEGQWTYSYRGLYIFFLPSSPDLSISVFLKAFSLDSQIIIVLLLIAETCGQKCEAYAFPHRTALIWTVLSISRIEARYTFKALFIHFHRYHDNLMPLLFDLAWQGGEKDYLPSPCGIPGRRNEEWRGDSNHSRSEGWEWRSSHWSVSDAETSWFEPNESARLQYARVDYHADAHLESSLAVVRLRYV